MYSTYKLWLDSHLVYICIYTEKCIEVKIWTYGNEISRIKLKILDMNQFNSRTASKLLLHQNSQQFAKVFKNISMDFPLISRFLPW